MNDSKNILYGGSLGTDEELCENKRSLGEIMLSKLDEADKNIVLVSLNQFHQSNI